MLVQPSLVMATLLTAPSSDIMFDFSTLYQAGISWLLKLPLEGGVYFGFMALLCSLQIQIQHNNSNCYCTSTKPSPTFFSTFFFIIIIIFFNLAYLNDWDSTAENDCSPFTTNAITALWHSSILSLVIFPPLMHNCGHHHYHFFPNELAFWP